MFGMDPHGHEARKTILTDATWVLDSNVLLRVVAKGSTQHKYAQSLLTLMTEFGISPVTTKRLVEEANGVFQWMLDKLTGVGHGREHSALLNVISNPTYRENPFVDGFILGHESGTWRNIREYIESVNWHSESGFVHALAELGVKVVEVPDEETDSSEDSTEILVSQLSDYRRGRGTLRSDTQVENEAEVMRLITAIRSEGGVGDSDQGKTAYFVSTSHALDNAFNKEGIITWSPSTLYNQLVYLTGKILDGEEAFQALTESFYSYGISIIDDNIYSAYFSQNITEANATFEEELDNYVVSMHEHVGEQKNEHDSVKEAFRNTPALHRPMFVEQMGWRAARKKDEELRKERREVERKEAQIEALREGNEKERRELVQEMEQKKKELEKKEEERKRHFAGRMRNLNKGRSKKGKRR
jgi:hypothetical protein